MDRAKETKGVMQTGFEKAWDGGDLGGCYELGKMYKDGIEVQKDSVMAKSVFKKACTDLHIKSCYQFVVMSLF